MVFFFIKLLLLTSVITIFDSFCHKVGGFRCDYRGALDLGVTHLLYQIPFYCLPSEGKPRADGDLLVDWTFLWHWIYLIEAVAMSIGFRFVEISLVKVKSTLVTLTQVDS